jgi:hypothetical protein
MLTAGARNQLSGTPVMVATRLMPMKDAAVPDEQHRTNQHAIAVRHHISFRFGTARYNSLDSTQLPKYSNLSEHAQYLASASECYSIKVIVE